MPPPVRPWPMYTDRPSIETVLSEAGVRLRLDFDGDGQVSTSEAGTPLGNVIQSASDTVDFYTWSKYDPNILVNSSLIWRWASVMAAFELDRLRNNPTSETLATWADEIQDKLTDIRDRGRILPGIALRMTCAPTHSNVRIDQRYQFRVIRVETRQSTPSGLPQATDFTEAYWPEP
jgi:hypothetical protein